MNLWDLFVALVLGIVEGLTEYAPVSSTGHMIIVDDLWLKSKEIITPEAANTFKVVIQLGSILAVMIVFKDRILNLLGLKKNITEEQKRAGHKLTIAQIAVGLVPAVILGFLFEDYIDKYLFDVRTVAVGLILGAVLMLVADWINKRKSETSSVDNMTYRQALYIGLFQCLALWPGFSRSGSTIAGGVILGLNHRLCGRLYIYHGDADYGRSKLVNPCEKCRIFNTGYVAILYRRLCECVCCGSLCCSILPKTDQ